MLESRAMAAGIEAARAQMAALVENSHLFKSLDEDAREQALGAAYICHYRAGETILQEGELGDAFYLVVGGTVQVQTARDGKDLVLSQLKQGAVFGEIAVLSSQRRTASVVAATEADVAVFEKGLVDRLLVTYPKVRKILETVMVGRARDTIEKLNK